MTAVTLVCGKCGAQNSSEVAVCSFCGTRLTEQENWKTIARHVKPPDLCWFCKRYRAEDVACMRVPTHANVSRRKYGNTIITRWTREGPVRVPRCRRCQVTHDIVDKIALTTALVTISAFVIWAGGGRHPGSNPIVVFGSPFVAILALRTVIRIFVPWRIRFERYALEHPAVIEARRAGKFPGSRPYSEFFYRLLGTKIR